MENIDDSSRLPKLRRLIMSQETRAIIDYLREHPNSTIDKVATHLQQEKICSRLTSLSVIEKLLAAGILKDDRRGKYFHSLTYDEGFNFTGLASTILKSDVKEILSILDRFVYSEIPTGDKANRLFEQLVYYVDEAMREHYRQVAYEKKEEAISAASKRHRNISKRKKKKA